MNIILIGMRGSGKSTIGKLLANKLDKKFMDLDKLLAEKVNMTLPKFVNENGWESFRDKESEVVNDISETVNAVIATGGGVVLRKSNIKILGKNGKFVFLKTSIETMYKRIKNAKNRPALTNKNALKEEMEEVWETRKDLYQQVADITIETDNKTLKDIVNEVLGQL